MRVINIAMRTFVATLVCLALCPLVAVLIAFAFIATNLCETMRGNEATKDGHGLALAGNIVACKLFPWGET